MKPSPGIVDPLMPLVSIIIVSWNARDYLLNCLATLNGATCRFPFEVIVVDNASSDGSAAAVRERFPGVQVLQNATNCGFAAANNQGIRASKGKYLCLVNSDVKVLAGCISRLVDYLEAHGEIGMAGPRVLNSDGSLQRSCRGFPTVWNSFCRTLALDKAFPRRRLFSGYALTYWAQDTERAVEMLSGCFWLVRKAAVDEVGLLDEGFFMYGEDMDWCKRFVDGGWPIAFVPGAEAIHYGGASSANAPIRFYIERHKADLRYWEKHHSKFGRACFYGFLLLHLSLRMAGYAVVSLKGGEENTSYKYKVDRSIACLKWLLGVGRSLPQQG